MNRILSTTCDDTYTYDANGRVLEVDGGSTASYVYNENGQRVRKNTGSTWTEYFYGPNGSVQSEYNGSWPVQYVYAGGRLLAIYQNGTTDFVHADQLGSTRLITAVNQGIVDNMDYEPFGQQTAGGSATTHKFTGKQRDGEDGLDYFGARYFGSTMGRFTSPDYADDDDGPVSIPDYNPSNPQSLNLYSYVRNNPITNTDPDGHDCVVQSRTSDTTENVTVSSGNCDNVSVGDGQTKTYVAGTVDVGSIQGNGSGGITFNYTSYSGDAGVASFNGAPVPDNPGLAYNWGNNAQGWQTLGVTGATMNDPRTYAIWFGASALGGAGLAASGAVAGGELTTLGDLGSDLTAHAEEAQMLARHGITPEQARAAIEAAKKSGDVVEAMGRYGPQLRYTANGIRVIVATTGRNAGKIITAFFK
jgi:RHS repeat-associated protein